VPVVPAVLVVCVVAGAAVAACGCWGGHLNKLAVCLGLDEAVHVAVTCSHKQRQQQQQ
jgi:hypothetical protein